MVHLFQIPGLRGNLNRPPQMKDDEDLRDLLLRSNNETDSDASSIIGTFGRRRPHTPGRFTPLGVSPITKVTCVLGLIQ